MDAREIVASTSTPSRPLTVAEVIARLSASPDDAVILDALERGAEALVSGDLAHRLVPYATRLREVDYEQYPWAALGAGIAICAIDRARGRSVLAAARQTFAVARNDAGEGWACFFEGLEELGEGRLARAEECWDRARTLLGHAAPASQFSALHQSLAAYGRGDLKRAVLIAEQALGSARLQRNDRIVAIAGVYLAFFRWWVGDFAGVERAATTAEQAFALIPDPLDRYEAPLMHAAFAAVATMRGDLETGEQRFTAGLAVAAELHNEWYDAIVRTIRAVVVSKQDPLRGIADARSALEYYERVGEEWWSHWALEAYVIAQREHGDLNASAAAGRRLLGLFENPLERGRSELELATTLILLGETEEPRKLLLESIGELEHAGARYLTARAELQLAQNWRNRSAYLMRSARSRAGSNADDPAWKLLLRGAPMHVQLLGTPRVEVEARELSFTTRHEVEALAALALAGSNGVLSERLCDMLWPGSDPVALSHRLDVVISSLRQNLLPAARLSRQNGMLFLDIDEHECDALHAIAECRRYLADRTHNVYDACASLRQRLLGGANQEWVVERQRDLDILRTHVERLLIAAVR